MCYQNLDEALNLTAKIGGIFFQLREGPRVSIWTSSCSLANYFKWKSAKSYLLLNLILINENACPHVPNFVKEFFDEKKQKNYNQAKKSPNFVLEGSWMLSSQEILQERQNFSKEIRLKKVPSRPIFGKQKI